MSIKSERGQILLVVVLTMIVALTVGLSLASRTVLNLRLSRQSEESQRAFQAAEAGVEQIIQSGGAGQTDPLGNNANYTTQVSYPSGTAVFLNGGEMVDQDTGIDVWLSSYPDFINPITTNLTIWWGTDNQNSSCGPASGSVTPESIKPAVEIIILSGNKLLPTVTKYFYEAVGCNRITTATAALTTDPAAPGNTTVHFNNRTNPISVTNGLLMRVIPVYNSGKIDITSTAALPNQGTIVQSTGTSGDTARKIQYFGSYPQVPVEIFPYTLISQ